MSNDEEVSLLELIFAEQQKTNQRFEDLINTLAAGLGREVKTLGEGKPAWREKSKRLLVTLNESSSSTAAAR